MTRLHRRPAVAARNLANQAAMDAVCGPVRTAGDRKAREAMARRVLRYAAIVLAAQIGVRAAAQHLASLAGRMFEEAEETDRLAPHR